MSTSGDLTVERLKTMAVKAVLLDMEIWLTVNTKRPHSHYIAPRSWRWPRPDRDVSDMFRLRSRD